MERKRESFTLSAQFPLYFLPVDQRLQNVQSRSFVLWELPTPREKTKNDTKRTRSTNIRERKRCVKNLPSFSGYPKTSKWTFSGKTSFFSLWPVMLRFLEGSVIPLSGIWATYRPTYASCSRPACVRMVREQPFLNALSLNVKRWSWPQSSTHTCRDLPRVIYIYVFKVTLICSLEGSLDCHKSVAGLHGGKCAI